MAERTGENFQHSIFRLRVRSTTGMELQKVQNKKRIYKYNLNEKKRLLLLAQSEGYTSKMVCEEYSIPKGTFWGWKRQIDTSIEYSKNLFTMHSGPKSTGEHLETIIDSFIEANEQGQKECTVDSIVLEIIKFDNEFMNADFSAIKKWLYRYLDRNDFAIRKKTHVAQKSCEVQICLDFVMYANDTRSLFRIPVDFVINMDETPCYYDNSPKRKVTPSC